MTDEMNGEVKIEKGVPMPAPTYRNKYGAVTNMEVGDSFVISETPGAGVLAGALSRSHRPKKFAGRKISPTERRIWRIA